MATVTSWPADKPPDANRAPSRTELVRIELTSTMRPTSHRPNIMYMTNGSTTAASTAAAPRRDDLALRRKRLNMILCVYERTHGLAAWQPRPTITTSRSRTAPCQIKSLQSHLKEVR